MWVVIIAGSVPPVWPLVSRPMRRLTSGAGSQSYTNWKVRAWKAFGRSKVDSNYAKHQQDERHLPDRSQFVELRDMETQAERTGVSKAPNASLSEETASPELSGSEMPAWKTNRQV